MNFGQALELLKQGKSIRKSGWNGKGLSIYLNKGKLPIDEDTLDKLNITVTEEDIDAKCIVTHVDGISTTLFQGYNGDITILPNLQMITVTGSHFAWTPNLLDILGEDWEEII